MKILIYTLLLLSLTVEYAYCGHADPTPSPTSTPSPNPTPTPDCTPYSELEVYTGGNSKEGCNSIIKGKFLVPEFLGCDLSLSPGEQMYRVIRGTCFTVTAGGASDTDVCFYDEDPDACTTDYELVSDSPIRVDNIYVYGSNCFEELWDQSPGDQPKQAKYRASVGSDGCCCIKAIFNDPATNYHTADDGTKESSTRAIQSYGVVSYIEGYIGDSGGTCNPPPNPNYSFYTSISASGIYECYSFARAPRYDVSPPQYSTSADAWADNPGIVCFYLYPDNKTNIVIPFQAKVKLSQVISRYMNIQTAKETGWTGGSDARAEHKCELTFHGATTHSDHFIESQDGQIQNLTMDSPVQIDVSVESSFLTNYEYSWYNKGSVSVQATASSNLLLMGQATSSISSSIPEVTVYLRYACSN